MPLWFLTKKNGIEALPSPGPVDITVDAILYFLFAHRLLPHQPRYLPKLCFATVASLVMLFVATIPQSMAAKALFLIPTLVIFGCVGWFWGLAPVERFIYFRTRGKISMKAEVN